MSKTSQNGTVDVLSGLRLPPIYEWVECELEDVNEGLVERPFKVKVLINAPRAEVIALSKSIAAVLDKGEAARDRELFDLVAPRITDWNVMAENQTGELVKLPPPAEAGGAAIEFLPLQTQSWLLRIVRNAHLGGETRSKLSRRPAAMASTSDERQPSGPQVVSTPTGDSHPDRRKNS